MSEQLTEVEQTKQLVIVKPTEKNLAIFCRYKNGETEGEIAESEGWTRQAVNHHINRVKSFLGDSWEKYVLTDMKMEFEPVKDSFNQLVKDNDSKTVNNYLNKMVYPDRSGKGTAIQLNVNNIVGGMSSSVGYDVDVKVVDDAE